MGGRGGPAKLTKVKPGGGGGAIGTGGGSGAGGGVTGGGGSGQVAPGGGGSAGGGPMAGYPGNPGQQGQGSPGAATAQKSATRFERKNGALNRVYKKKLEDKFEQGTDEAKRVYDKFVPDGGVVSDLKATGACYYPDHPYYGVKADTIDLNAARDQMAAGGLKEPGDTWFHEHGHYIDAHTGRQSQNYQFVDAVRVGVRNTENRLLRTSTEVRNALREDGYSEASIDRMLNGSNVRSTLVHIGSFTDPDVDLLVTRLLRKEVNGLGHPNISGIQDAFSGYNERYNKLLRTPGSHWFGHDWNGYYDNVGFSHLGSEAFANMFQASFSPGQIQAWKTYFPEAWSEFEAILGGL